MTGASDASGSGAPAAHLGRDAAITVVSGAPTEEEIAAIAALFTGLRLDRAISVEALPDAALPSEWDRTRRPLRAPWPVEKQWRDR